MDRSFTRETPAAGVVVWQPARGFRYSAESFWLVGFSLTGEVPSSAVDLGTGSGIMALLLAAHGVDVVGVDRFGGWTDAWQRSNTDSTRSVDFRVGDVADLDGRFELAVSNPPFFPAGSGPVAADPLKASARTESSATLVDFARVALTVAERACFVVPRDREGELHRFGVRRRVHVGRRRTLLELGGSEVVAARCLSEDDPEVRRWYALATRQGPA